MCADKRGLENGDRFIGVAARTAAENRRIVEGLCCVLNRPRTRSLSRRTSRPIHTRRQAVATSV
jgi:hypothetical protein